MTEKVLVFKDIKNKRWTIWNETRTQHLGYADTLTLKNCSFVVIEEKRKKVVKNKSRFPHAWVVGEISTVKKTSGKSTVHYNPFTMKTFQDKNGKAVLKSKETFFTDSGSVLFK